MHQILPHSALKRTIDEQTLDTNLLYQSVTPQNAKPISFGQERAIEALELGLHIQQRGYHIFAVGASGTGRTSTIRAHLQERARGEATPSDILLVYNFDDRDRPLALELPAGEAHRVKTIYDRLVDELLRDLEKGFEGDAYSREKEKIDQAHEARIDTALTEAKAAAAEVGFILSRNQSALQLTVADPDGNPLDESVYENLSAEDREALEAQAETLQPDIEKAVRKVRLIERETDKAVEMLMRRTGDQIISPLLQTALADAEHLDSIKDHLQQLKNDVLDRLDRLVGADAEGEQEGESNMSMRRRLLAEEEDSGLDEPALLRYRVNVFVSHEPGSGAPVVSDEHPTMANLFGRIVHHPRAGDTTTDHTRVRAGSLYKANGGYLIISAQDLLSQPASWEALKRALKGRKIDLDDPGEQGRMVTIASLRPQATRLHMKVCLIGTPELYYMLSHDPEFSKLFKVKVDFDLEMEHNAHNVDGYHRFLVGLTQDEGLKPLTASAAARLIEHAIRIADDQDKLTTRFGWIADLLREASFYATRRDATHIDKQDVLAALKGRRSREGFVEKRVLDEFHTGRVRLEVDGAVVGQINGLTVLEMGRYAFGMPARITCRVGAGKHRLISIERESHMSGSIHIKGTQIIRGILMDRFGQNRPLNLMATFCMEQSYSDIDGDSASMAETLALMSALSGIPIQQKWAVTGSIDQRGIIQTVGGINEKLTGFYRAAQSLNAHNPVAAIIPRANAKDLMLEEEVIEACEQGRFVIHTVDTLEDAVELLMDTPYEEVHRRVANRLDEYNKALQGYLIS